jgi:hypothetical protein
MYGTLIASTTVGSGGTSSIDFTSIPQTFTDLIVVLSSRISGSGNSRLNLNSSGSSFSSKAVYSFATNAPLAGPNTVEIGFAAQSSMQTNYFGAMQLHLPNYRSSVAKPFSVDSTAASFNGGYVFMHGGAWNNTAAITTLSVLPPSGNTFVENTTAYLYGLLAGSGGATVAAT